MGETTATERLSKAERHVLDHSLGRPKDYRNYFATHEEGKDYATIRGLVERGLMEQGRSMPAEMGGMLFFHVTDAGRSALATAPTEGADDD